MREKNILPPEEVAAQEAYIARMRADNERYLAECFSLSSILAFLRFEHPPKDNILSS